MTKTVRNIITVPVVVIALAFAALAITTGDAGSHGASVGNREGRRIDLYATVGGVGAVTVLVEARVESNVRGVIHANAPGRPMIGPAPYRRSFPVQSGETVTATIKAGVNYSGALRTVECRVSADTGPIPGASESITKKRATPVPDAFCRGSVTAP